MMTLKTFAGGINLRDNKDAKDSPIEIILPGKELVYPLAGQFGTSAKAMVKIGEKVLAGQKIGRADGFFSVPVHASVSGTVKGIKQRKIFTGEKVRSIIIENDQLYDEIDYAMPSLIEDLTNAEIINRIQDAGIVGMSGSGYPTHSKLSPPDPDKISHVIINGAESEPYLAANHRLMLEESRGLISGIQILLKLFPYARGLIAIADDKPDCIQLLYGSIQKEPRISVKVLKNKYPQGAERQIITAVTGRFMDSSVFPADIGVILLNIETVFQIHRAVKTGRNLTSRIITVAGDALKQSHNFSVRLGTSYQSLIEAAGGYMKKPEKIISGGPMMGHAITETDIPVTKQSTAMLCFTKDFVAASRSTACINCLKCVAVCPEKLYPLKLARFAEFGEEEAFHRYHGKECVNCGCCRYICQAKLPIAARIVRMKGTHE
jgi:electron transport complex protein RnfC